MFIQSIMAAALFSSIIHGIEHPTDLSLALKSQVISQETLINLEKSACNRLMAECNLQMVENDNKKVKLLQHAKGTLGLTAFWSIATAALWKYPPKNETLQLLQFGALLGTAAMSFGGIIVLSNEYHSIVSLAQKRHILSTNLQTLYNNYNKQ